MDNLEGKVKFFKVDKGYGFVIQDETEFEYFFHIKKCPNLGEVTQDTLVTFEIESTKRGPNAVNVKPIK
jgi:CspA family cold shock protein